MLVTKSKIKEAIQAKKEEMKTLPVAGGMKRVVFLAKVSARKYHAGTRYEDETVKTGDESAYDNDTAFYTEIKLNDKPRRFIASPGANCYA